MPLNHSSQYAQLTPKQFEAVGRLVIEWSNIEFLLGAILSRLLFVPEFLGRTYTDEMNAVRIEAAIKNALEIHSRRYGNRVVPKETEVRIENLLKRIGEFRTLRNKFAHFCWSRSTDDEIFGTRLSGKLPTPKREKSESVTISMRDLDNAYAEAYSIVEEALVIVETLPNVEEEESLQQKNFNRTC